MPYIDRGPVCETEEERRSLMEWYEKEDLKKSLWRIARALERIADALDPESKDEEGYDLFKASSTR